MYLCVRPCLPIVGIRALYRPTDQLGKNLIKLVGNCSKKKSIAGAICIHLVCDYRRPPQIQMSTWCCTQSRTEHSAEKCVHYMYDVLCLDKGQSLHRCGRSTDVRSLINALVGQQQKQEQLHWALRGQTHELMTDMWLFSQRQWMFLAVRPFGRWMWSTEFLPMGAAVKALQL